MPDVEGEVIDLNDPQLWLRPVQNAHNGIFKTDHLRVHQ